MKKKLSLLLALCLLAVPLTACQRGGADEAQSDTLVIATTADVSSLDPSRMASGAETYASSCVYDPLTWLPLGAEEPLMRIAESYTVSDDGLSYAFTLRDDVLFHDGTALTAEDVLYSIELFRSSAVLATYSYSIAGCEAPDDSTIDKQMCSDVIYGGRATVLTTPLPSVAVERPQGVEGYSYDPEKARELLAEAGYPDGEGLRSLSIQTYEAAAEYAEVIQANLTEIGITSEIEIAEINAFISDAFAGNVDLFILDVGLGSNPAAWMSMFVTDGQLNFAHYRSARVDELYAEAVANPDRDQRQELYSEIFRIVMDEDAAMIPILGGCSCHVFSNELEIGDALETCYSTALPYDLSFR